jgi:gamma-glutamyl-gamma-aminobutyrate hydrolase PuuD
MRSYDPDDGRVKDDGDGNETPPEERGTGTVRSSSEGSPPVIGLPLPVQQGKTGPMLVADAVGAWAVERMGGRVLLIPLWPFPPHPQMYHSLWQLVPLVDGLLLPARIGGSKDSGDREARVEESEAEQWARVWERALIQLVTYLGMPLLAIAEGAAVWNRALGGTGGEPMLRLETMASPPPGAWEHHAIRVRSRSSLALTLQSTIREQGGQLAPWNLVTTPGSEGERLAPGLAWCAQSEEGTPVAFERRDGVFGLGVLGRLDWGLDQPYSRVIFAAFLQACRASARSREEHAGWEAARETICTSVEERVRQGQSLIAGYAIMQRQPAQSPGPRAAPVTVAHEPVAEVRVRARSPLPMPTKAELNRIRRQRLKLAAR